MKQKRKDFWEFQGEELCNSAGVLTLASQMNGGIRPSRTTFRKWLANGLPYKNYISHHYIFRVATVKHFLHNLNKPREQWGYKQEVQSA